MMVEWNEHFGWMYSGVNTSFLSSGGPRCVAFLTKERKLIELVIFCLMSLLQIYSSWRRISLPNTILNPKENHSRCLLLALLSLTFGIEVGFKLSTQQFIWLLNPCHIITIAQIYLLSCPPSKMVTAIFRLHLYYLIGPIEALLIPVTDSRNHIFEKEIYYIQHILIFVTPHYLFKSKGVYTVEHMLDFNWSLMALGGVFLYHFSLMNFIAEATQVNLNNILCPAMADPFYGRWYRVAAVIHQTFLMVVVGKLYPQISDWLTSGSLPLKFDVVIERLLNLRGIFFLNNDNNCGGVADDDDDDKVCGDGGGFGDDDDCGDDDGGGYGDDDGGSGDDFVMEQWNCCVSNGRNNELKIE